jgi:predicted Zn-dependent protease
VSSTSTRTIDSKFFTPIPPPVHRDDWSAKVREEPQSLQELVDAFGSSSLMRSRLPAKGRGSLCILPLTTNSNHDDDLPTKVLRKYIRAYFDFQDVCLLKPITLKPGKVTKGKHQDGSLLGSKIGWRNVCPANGKTLPNGQYNASNLLDVVRVYKRRKVTTALRILAVTMADLYSGKDDLFTCGLADMKSVGIFSFARYHPDRDNFSLAGEWSSTRKNAMMVSRACKTAVHEIAHLFNIGHCVYRHCCMNGSGHLREDFSIPHHLCPVCLAKLKWVMGDFMDLKRRAMNLIQFYQENLGFEEEAQRLTLMLQKIEAMP